MGRLRHGRRYPFTLLCKKQTKPHHIFRYAQTPTRKKATCRRQSCCVPLPASALFHPARRSKHHLLIIVSLFPPVLQRYLAQTGFYVQVMQTTKFFKINQLIQNTKISRSVVHIVLKKVVHSRITVYSFGVLTACCATKRGCLTVARQVRRWFLVLHFLFVT